MKKIYTKSDITQLLMKQIIDDFKIDGPLKKDEVFIEIVGDFPERVEVRRGFPEGLETHKNAT